MSLDQKKVTNRGAANGRGPQSSSATSRHERLATRSVAPGGSAPRHRSRGLVTLAALLVVGMGLTVAAWGVHAGDRQSVLAVGSPVAKGQPIARSDLVSSSVAGVRDSVPVADLAMLVGRTASVDLLPGQIMTRSMVTDTVVPGRGSALVGLSLDPARVPGAGLRPGDQVQLIRTPGGADAASGTPVEDLTSDLDSPEVLASEATVYSVDGSTTDGSQVLLTVIAPAADSARIAAYSSQGRVAVIETSLSDSGS